MGDIYWMAASLQQYHMGADIRHLPCTESGRIQRWRPGMLLIPIDLLFVTITGGKFAKKKTLAYLGQKSSKNTEKEWPDH